MDPRDKKSTKIIKIIFLIIIAVILIELIIAGVLFFNEKKNQKKDVKIENTTNNESIKLITEIEEDIILKKTPVKIEQPRKKEVEKIDTDPRTRPLPNLSF